MTQAVPSLEYWFRRHARHLPWRQTQDPYRIWISEVMLQQTQVRTVIPYYERFIARFSSLEALAKAPQEEVLQHWSGLGYYSRARNLQKGAQYLVEKHQGRFPLSREELLQVPGVGPYTAGAILSIAFDQAEAIVDGNVQRVFSRVYDFDKPISSKEATRFFWEMAARWVAAAKSPRILNQSLMELGATVCTKSSPRCTLCPIQRHCLAHQHGSEALRPVREPRRKSVPLYLLSLVVQSEQGLYLKKNPKGSWWADLWDFPRVELVRPDAGEKEARRIARQWKTAPPSLLGRARHTVTLHKLEVTPYLYRVKHPTPGRSFSEGTWICEKKIHSLPLSSLARKVLALLPPTPR